MLVKSTLALLLLNALLACAAPTAEAETAPILDARASEFPHLNARACAPIHIIAARASTEDPGAGVIGSLATFIQNDRPGTTLETVDYPATLTDYAASSASGTAALKIQLIAYVNACPNSKVVLLGYSQVSSDNKGSAMDSADLDRVLILLVMLSVVVEVELLARQRLLFPPRSAPRLLLLYKWGSSPRKGKTRNSRD